MSTERERYSWDKSAYDVILTWCRYYDKKQGWPVMRQLLDGTCAVLDMNAREKDPNSKYDWEMRQKRIVIGNTWNDVLDALHSKGLI